MDKFYLFYRRGGKGESRLRAVILFWNGRKYKKKKKQIGVNKIVLGDKALIEAVV